MKNTMVQLVALLVLSAFAACGNQTGHTPLKDTTTEAAPSPLPTDTTQKDTMVNNGERLQGTDTSARHR